MKLFINVEKDELRHRLAFDLCFDFVTVVPPLPYTFFLQNFYPLEPVSWLVIKILYRDTGNRDGKGDVTNFEISIIVIYSHYCSTPAKKKTRKVKEEKA